MFCSCRPPWNYDAAVDTANLFLRKRYFHEICMHQTWLGDEVRYELAFQISNSKMTKTAVTTSLISTAVQRPPTPTVDQTLTQRACEQYLLCVTCRNRMT
jgi:hypothetical protein